MNNKKIINIAQEVINTETAGLKKLQKSIGKINLTKDKSSFPRCDYSLKLLYCVYYLTFFFRV